MRLPIKAATEIRARKLIAPQSRVLVGLSGGPDSVALLHCLLELSQKRDLQFVLAAAHLNHRLRGKDSTGDAGFCNQLCKKAGIELLSASCTVKPLSKKIKKSIEETARECRHNFLQWAAQLWKADCIALAHHADDRIETVLYRLSRGTGQAGLTGIHWSNPDPIPVADRYTRSINWKSKTIAAPKKKKPVPLVRPLLGCFRVEIETYLKQKKVRARKDQTNRDNRIPRNAIRNQVLPLLEKKVHPGIRDSLWRFAEEHGEQSNAGSNQNQLFVLLAQAANRKKVSVSLNQFQLSKQELKAGLQFLMQIWQLPVRSITAKQFKTVAGLLGTSGEKRSVKLSAGLTVQRKGKELVIRR